MLGFSSGGLNDLGRGILFSSDSNLWLGNNLLGGRFSLSSDWRLWLSGLDLLSRRFGLSLSFFNGGSGLGLSFFNYGGGLLGLGLLLGRGCISLGLFYGLSGNNLLLSRRCLSSRGLLLSWGSIDGSGSGFGLSNGLLNGGCRLNLSLLNDGGGLISLSFFNRGGCLLLRGSRGLISLSRGCLTGSLFSLSRGCLFSLSRGCLFSLSRGCFLSLSRGCFLSLSRGCLLGLSRGCFGGDLWLISSNGLFSLGFLMDSFRLISLDLMVALVLLLLSGNSNIIVTMDALLGIHCNWMVLFLLDLVLVCFFMGSCSLFMSNLRLLSLGLFNESGGCLSGHSAGKASKVGGLLELIAPLTDLKVFSSDVISVFAFKVDTNLVVDERDHHTVMERDQR